MNLIAEFERFEAAHPRANPARMSETTAFIQDLSTRGILQDFTDVDWLKLAERLELTDDQYAAMFEGTASWIVPESESVQDQEPADWPDETPVGKASSAPATRANPQKQASRGSSSFEKLLKALLRDWELDEAEVDAIEEIRIVDGVYEVRVEGSKTWEEIVEE